MGAFSDLCEPFAEGDLSLIDFLRVWSRRPTSASGAVTIELTDLLLRDRCSFELRGPIEVKGKGLMSPYLIVRPKPASVSPAAALVISAAG